MNYGTGRGTEIVNFIDFSLPRLDSQIQVVDYGQGGAIDKRALMRHNRCVSQNRGSVI
jgi:hypothetical protein